MDVLWRQQNIEIMKVLISRYDESIIQTNYGNFRSLPRFKSMDDFILDKRLKNSISFAIYTRFEVQNDIVNIFAVI